MDKSPDWDSAWSHVDFETLTPLETGLFSRLIDLAVPAVAPGSKMAIEIGCFPGRFIEYVGQKGYVINGVDTYARVGEIAHWAARRGRAVGAFRQDTLDGFVKHHREPFDIVLSLGFIEHFNDFCDVLYSHLQLCAVGGRIVVGTPNFASPLQRALHQVLDDRNTASHVLEAMYPAVWATYLSALGVRVDFAGPLGGFGFWTDTELQNPRAQLLQTLVPQLSGAMQKMSPPFNEREASYVATIGTKTRPLPPRDEVAELSRHCVRLAAELSGRDQRLARPCIDFVTELCR
jgi:2-polyprenyl-3-methyl-5-hydroxy-6-metoxy-1,4-benzoquinol methylase